ncbi:MAG: thioredoxin-disulfide reductase [Pelotomaculum sp.]
MIKKVLTVRKRDLIIIGGGPAGLSAGIYASRFALNTLLIERRAPGGLVTSTQNIENYPGFLNVSGAELMMQMEQQARGFGLEIITVNVDKIEPSEKEVIIYTSKGAIAADTLIVATGTQPQLLNVKGEAEFTGRGVSYCATCDGAFFKDKRVIVTGGGDAAIEEAIFLTKFAKKVYIVHRRGELKATEIIQQRAFNNPKIEFVWHSVIDEISGTDAVDKTLLRDVRNNAQMLLPTDGVFVYIGNSPNSDLVKDIVRLDEQGYIVTDDNMLTSQPGIYAAGDVRHKILRQVVTAVADGAVAAASVKKYLEDKKGYL